MSIETLGKGVWYYTTEMQCFFRYTDPYQNGQVFRDGTVASTDAPQALTQIRRYWGELDRYEISPFFRRVSSVNFSECYLLPHALAKTLTQEPRVLKYVHTGYCGAVLPEETTKQLRVWEKRLLRKYREENWVCKQSLPN